MKEIKYPQIKPHFRVEIVEPLHVYLLDEYTSHVLTGKLYSLLVPFFDGNHTLNDIVQKLDGQVNCEHVEHVFERLNDKGYLTEAAPNLVPEAAAFWSTLNIDPAAVSSCLQQSQVYLTAVGQVSFQSLANALTDVGIQNQSWQPSTQLSTPNSLLAVITDDYLQPNLADINQLALSTNQPWLLIKPIGNILWLGPIFVPGKTGCWECLAYRLRGNREVEASILRQRAELTNLLKIEEGCLPTARATLPSTLGTAFNLATTEIAKWILKAGSVDMVTFPTLEGKILTFDQTSLKLQNHVLPHRPQCSTCGDPTILSRRGFQPVILNACQKHFTSDGGHRAVTPDETIQNNQHLISPITGIVSALVRVSEPDNPLLHVYSAVHRFGTPASLEGLRHNLRHKSAGKGKTDRQSKASGFCEAVERYSGIYQGDEPRIQGTFAKLGDKAIHPRQYLHFSTTQYENREELNNKNSVAHDWIPQPFDENREIEWTPIWSLTEQTHKYIPTAYCYYDYSLPRDYRFCRADSNGNAAGNILEEAILQGFMELVERDSIAIWWYNRLKRPAVDLASFDEPYFLELQAYYKNKSRDLWVLDLTADLGIPAFAAVSRCIDGSPEKIIAGFGAHFDPKIAILRAVTEVNQIGLGCDGVDSSQQQGEYQEWLLNATLKNQPYLVPELEVVPKVKDDYPQRWSNDIYQDVMTCVEIARNAGLETLVLDQTRPDINLKVVKVIVPGLRYFWSRFGSGRLYEVPVKMGWLATPQTEEQMNPVPMPF